VSLLRRAPSSPEERQEKAQLRAVRLQRTREARAATRRMVGAEAKYGIYVSVFLVAVSLYSYLSTDVINKVVTVKGKNETLTGTTTHPAQAVVVFVLALLAAGSIYWHQRMITGLSYIVTAFFAFQTPFPKAAQDLIYLVFFAPVAYATWMLMFRMNKEQKEWLNKHYPAPARATSSARGSSRNVSRRAGKTTSASTARPAARASSGRYTPPRAKTKAAPRKS